MTGSQVGTASRQAALSANDLSMAFRTACSVAFAGGGVVLTATVVVAGAAVVTGTVEVAATFVVVTATADVVALGTVDGGRVSNVGPAFLVVQPAKTPTLSADTTTIKRKDGPRCGTVRTGTMGKERSFRSSRTLPPHEVRRSSRKGLVRNRAHIPPSLREHADICLHHERAAGKDVPSATVQNRCRAARHRALRPSRGGCCRPVYLSL